MKEATNASAGRATSSAGVPDWRSSPVDDHADPLGERGRVLEVVRDEQHRDAELVQQLVQLGADAGLRVRVERGERLVEEQHGRVARERARERDALALAAGQAARPLAREVRDRRSARGSSSARCRPPYSTFCAHAQVREERVVLEHEPDAPALRRQARCRGRRRTTSRRPTRSDPLRGLSSPATARSTVVLPAPDGPTSATRRRRPEGQPEVERPKRDGEVVEAERCHERPSRRATSRSDADDDEQAAHRERHVEVVGVELGVDRERQRLREALQAAREHDRRAELAEAAREREGEARRAARRARAAGRRGRTCARARRRACATPRRGSGRSPRRRRSPGGRRAGSRRRRRRA